MGARARRFFARINRLELSTPFVEASSGNPEFLGKFIDAFAGLHPLYGCALKLPGIRFLLSTGVPLPESVPIATVPIQGVIPSSSQPATRIQPDLATLFVWHGHFDFPSRVFRYFNIRIPERFARLDDRVNFRISGPSHIARRLAAEKRCPTTENRT